MMRQIIVAAFLGLFGLMGCAGEIDESAPTVFEPQEPGPGQKEMRARFSSIADTVFRTSCALSGCHNGTQRPNLTPNVAYNNIVNIPSSAGDDYIEPGDPNRSYLYRKITGNNIFGDRMPRGRPPLSQAKIDSIRKWILDGAPQN